MTNHCYGCDKEIDIDIPISVFTRHSIIGEILYYCTDECFIQSNFTIEDKTIISRKKEIYSPKNRLSLNELIQTVPGTTMIQCTDCGNDCDEYEGCSNCDNIFCLKGNCHEDLYFCENCGETYCEKCSEDTLIQTNDGVYLCLECSDCSTEESNDESIEY